MTITARIQALETAIGVTNTKLQTLIDDLAGLRGTGPENTIRSINQSIWNMVGPAPGRTLTEIYTELLAIKTNLGLPTGDATTTAIGRLAALEYALTNNSAATLYALLWDVQQTLTLPGSIDRTILQELDLIRIAANTTNSALNPPTTPTTPPPGSSSACASPYTSSGQGVGSSLAAFLGQTVTYATWGGSPPAGVSIGSAYVTAGDTLASADWGNYFIYVASRASTFGVSGASAQRFNTNTWVQLSGANDFTFFVDGINNIVVTICPDTSVNLDYVYTAEIVTVNGGTEYAIVWPLGMDAVATLGGYTRSDRVYRVGDFYGWRVRTITGTCMMDRWLNDSWLGEEGVSSSQTTIMVHTTHINFRDGGPYTIELLPPL